MNVGENFVGETVGLRVSAAVGFLVGTKLKTTDGFSVGDNEG